MDAGTFNLWFVVVGVLLIGMALVGSLLKRLPLSAAILYLGVGVLLGPNVVALLRFDPVAEAGMLERVTEVAVIISLFTAGLKLRVPLIDGRWKVPLRLASLSMLVTVGLITLAGVWLLGLPLGAAVLLGGVLAPTDPVLASDVQVEHPFDQNRLRFGLTGEAGLNDGTAFPFVLLGLGLLGLHDLGEFGWRWVLVDLVWAVGAGLLIGGVLGTLVGRLVLYLRAHHREAVGLDDFLALGLIALSYGVALLAHSYGFLAVFAAGLALRRVELQSSGAKPPEDVQKAAVEGNPEEKATDPEEAPAYMAQAVLNFNEQLERIGEVGVVVLLGALLTLDYLALEELWFVPLVLLVIRPLAVAVGLLGGEVSRLRTVFMMWFGIRGIGSLYYLTYAIHNGLPPEIAAHLTALTLTTVAVSIIAHGISVTPLMNRYGDRTD